MAAGDGLSPRQQESIEDAVQGCRAHNGLDLTVLVGDLELEDLQQFRTASERLHAALGARSRSAILLVVAPGQRRVEIVTGPEVRRRVPDRVSALAALAMTTAFRGGDLVGGIVRAVQQIAAAAGPGSPLAIAPQKSEIAVQSGH